MPYLEKITTKVSPFIDVQLGSIGVPSQEDPSRNMLGVVSGVEALGKVFAVTPYQRLEVVFLDSPVPDKTPNEELARAIKERESGRTYSYKLHPDYIGDKKEGVDKVSSKAFFNAHEDLANVTRKRSLSHEQDKRAQAAVYVKNPDGTRTLAGIISVGDEKELSPYKIQVKTINQEVKLQHQQGRSVTNPSTTNKNKSRGIRGPQASSLPILVCPVDLLGRLALSKNPPLSFLSSTRGRHFSDVVDYANYACKRLQKRQIQLIELWGESNEAERKQIEEHIKRIDREINDIEQEFYDYINECTVRLKKLSQQKVDKDTDQKIRNIASKATGDNSFLTEKIETDNLAVFASQIIEEIKAKLKKQYGVTSTYFSKVNQTIDEISKVAQTDLSHLKEKDPNEQDTDKKATEGDREISEDPTIAPMPAFVAGKGIKTIDDLVIFARLEIIKIDSEIRVAKIARFKKPFRLQYSYASIKKCNTEAEFETERARVIKELQDRKNEIQVTLKEYLVKVGVMSDKQTIQSTLDAVALNEETRQKQYAGYSDVMDSRVIDAIGYHDPVYNRFFTTFGNIGNAKQLGDKRISEIRLQIAKLEERLTTNISEADKRRIIARIEKLQTKIVEYDTDCLRYLEDETKLTAYYEKLAVAKATAKKIKKEAKAAEGQLTESPNNGSGRQGQGQGGVVVTPGESDGEPELA